MRPDYDRPIGIFDSGIGGLTVAQEITRLLPQEQIVYFGDTARVPYGSKSKESVIRFSKDNMNILLQHQVKAVVIACNTSTSWALKSIRKEYDIPVMGVIEPGAHQAVRVTKKNRIGVIATLSTVNSHQYKKTILKLAPQTDVFEQPCPLFVPLVEEGWLEHTVTEKVAEEYLSSLKQQHIDTLILGCTHYPLLKPILQKVMGKQVVLVDSAMETARQVKELLIAKKLLRQQKRPLKNVFLVSDEPEHFRALAKRFLGHDLTQVRRVDYV